MRALRTDLALEAAEIFRQGQKSAARLEGILQSESLREGYGVTRTEIVDPAAAHAIGKPAGRYVTVDLRPYFRRQGHFFGRGVRCLAAELRALLPPEHGTVLAVGLGNRGMTADAVGPLVLENLLVTRHMETFPFSTAVAALAPGVLAATGMETAELIRGAVQQVRPAVILVIDALAARSAQRLCAAVQLSDTGLIPGSGVGNHRRAIDRETMGVPVLSMGLPTVMDAATMAVDLTGADEPPELPEPLFVTTRDVDQRVRELSGLMKVMPFLAVGYVIAGLANLGLPGLSGFVAEMTIFNGAFMNNDTFHRVVTIIACTSIVITAVYILRVIGRILYGTCRNEAHLKLTDATWDERLTVICLIAAIAGMGTMPLWISDMVSGSVSTIISQLMN